MQSIIRMYEPIADFFISENKSCFWVGAAMHIRKNVSPPKELLHLFCKTEPQKTGTKHLREMKKL